MPSSSSSQPNASFQDSGPPPYIRIRLTHIDTTHTSVKELPQESSSDRQRAEADERYGGIPYIFKRSPILGASVAIEKVPVIRIFGATELGQRCLLHVHGTAPYVYVQYKGDLNPDKVHDYILRFGRALNFALGGSFKRPTTGDKAQYVGFIALVRGVPFYGFHVGYSYFLKIMLLAPQFKSRLCELLKGGTVMGTSFETFEAHINFAQQFMTDYNLYGCGYVDLERVKFRDQLPTADEVQVAPLSSDASDVTPSKVVYTEDSVPARMRYPPGRSPGRISPHSSLELDVHVSAILNRHRVTPRYLHHDFTEYLANPYPADQRLVFSVRELWIEEGKRRAEMTGDPPPRVEQEFDERRYGPGESPPWAQIDMLQAQFDRLVGEDQLKYQAKHGSQLPDFHTFAPPPDQGALSMIPTAYDSTECVFPSTWEKQEQQANPYGIWSVQGIGIGHISQSDGTLRDPRLDVNEAQLPSLKSPTKSTAELSDEEPDFYAERSDDSEAEERARNIRAGYDVTEEEIELSDEDGEAPPVAGPQRAPTPHNGPVLKADLPPSSPEDVTMRPQEREDEDLPPTSPIAMPIELPPTQMRKIALGSSMTDIHLSDFQPSPPASANGDSGKHDAFFGKRTPKTSPTKPVIFGMHASRIARVPPGHTHGHGYDGLAKRSREDQQIGWARKGETTLERMLKQRSPTKESNGAVLDAAEEESLVAVEAPAQLVDSEEEDEKVIAPLGQERSRDYEEVYQRDLEEMEGQLLSPTQLVYQIEPEEEAEADDEDEPPVKIRRVETEHAPSPAVKELQQSSLVSINTDSTGVTTDNTITPEIPPVPRFEHIGPPSQLRDSECTLSPSFITSRSRLAASALISNSTIASITTSSSYHGTRFQYAFLPPTTRELQDTIESYGLRQKVWTDPFFGKPNEVPKRTWEYASRSYRVPGNTMRWVGDFVRETRSHVSGPVEPPVPHSAPRWEYALPPPSKRSLEQWAAAHRIVKETGIDGEEEAGQHLQQPELDVTDFPLFSQMEGPTQLNQFKFTQMKQGAEAIAREPQHMAILSMELQARSRLNKEKNYQLRPDPAVDPIDAIFFCLQKESDGPLFTGYFAVRDAILPDLAAIRDKRMLPKLGLQCDFVYLAESELDLLNEFHDRFHEWDPEVLCGYEVQYASWGYLLERAEYYDLHLVRELGRTTEQSTGRHQGKQDRWSYTTTSSIKLTGRHCLPIWRVLKADVNLTQYSFENVAFHVLRERVPHYAPHVLTKWMASRQPHLIARTFEYWLRRAAMDVRMLDQAEIVTRNAEFARIYGVDFDSVLQRGSQYKVESFMFRIAKPESFVLLSPNRVEVGKQNAAECIPLIMEPKSAFYTSPVLVLDFQSLYPSVMIAYNMCYSTCLGRTTKFRGVWKLGITKLEHKDGTLTLLREHVNITPNGIIFLKPHIRKSLLAKMLTELLDTRVMVKSSMKRYTDKALLKMLNARQLGLKFIANVTYGYTSATFSGRMPCVEIADAIVQTGRETLERAREMIDTKSDWGAKVVYGDTDSLFVELKGKTREEAFRIGKDIADSISKVNPAPVKLKFEKVYLPCILAAKKRYVGFKYETLKDLEPDFDAKGIETVRRDGFPAMQKMVETSLKILFRTKDISEVKAYVTRQWQKLQMGVVSPQDYVFAKEVKMGTYSDKVLPPPGVALAGAKTKLDPRAEPNYGERFPYVLTENGGKTQVDRAMTIEDFMEHGGHRLWASHYIQMMTKALARMFNLAGVNVEHWRSDVKSIKMIGRALVHPNSSQIIEIDAKQLGRITGHFQSSLCRSCRKEMRLDPKSERLLCAECEASPEATSYNLMTAARTAQQRQLTLHRICASCSASTSSRPHEGQACDSTDCPIFYSRKRADWDVEQLRPNNKVVKKAFTRVIEYERE